MASSSSFTRIAVSSSGLLPRTRCPLALLSSDHLFHGRSLPCGRVSQKLEFRSLLTQARLLLLTPWATSSDIGAMASCAFLLPRSLPLPRGWRSRPLQSGRESFGVIALCLLFGVVSSRGSENMFSDFLKSEARAGVHQENLDVISSANTNWSRAVLRGGVRF